MQLGSSSAVCWLVLMGQWYASNQVGVRVPAPTINQSRVYTVGVFVGIESRPHAGIHDRNSRRGLAL